MFCHCDRARQVKLTVYPERREAQYGGVPWWIIVLSILFGLMLLALLAFLLWKVGQQTGNTPRKHILQIHFFRKVYESVKHHLQNNCRSNNSPLLSVESLGKRIKRTRQKKRD